MGVTEEDAAATGEEEQPNSAPEADCQHASGPDLEARPTMPCQPKDVHSHGGGWLRYASSGRSAHVLRSGNTPPTVMSSRH